MDGQSIDLDPKTKEALRQTQVYEAAMASIQAKKRSQEAGGYAVMAAMSALGTPSEKKGYFGGISLLGKMWCALIATSVALLLLAVI